MSTQNQFIIQNSLPRQQALQISPVGFIKLLNTAPLSNALEYSVEQSTHVFRNRIWTPLTTAFAFIWQQLTPNGSCDDAVSAVQLQQIQANQTPCSSNTSAYCQARKRLPEEGLWQGLKLTGQGLDSQAQWGWRGRPVKLVDGSTLTMSDTPENQAAYPQESNQKSGLGFPIMRIGVLGDLNTGAILDCKIAPYSGKGTGETALLRQMLPDIHAADIILLDRYYECYWTLASLKMQGADALTPKRGNRKIDWTQGTRLGDVDRLLTWQKPKRPEWMTEDEYRHFPDTLQVRAFRIHKRTYITTMLDSRLFKKNALRRLYQQRWHIELDLRVIKRTMDMEPLQCKTPAMVRKEIATTLIAYNMVRMLITQAAITYNLWPRHISFKGAMKRFRNFILILFGVNSEQLPVFVESLLKTIASIIVGKRSGRQEPRALKRRKANRYPYLNKPRTTVMDEIEAKNKSDQVECIENSGDARCAPA